MFSNFCFSGRLIPILFFILIFSLTTVQASSIHYLHPDHLGGTAIVTDEGNNVEEITDYTAFGAIRQNQSKGFSEKRKFSGHEYDVDTALSYMQNRYYDSRSGKFISIDPLFLAGDFDLSDPQSMNSYSYVTNNPLRYRDPDGQRKEDFIAASQAASRVGQQSGSYKGVPIYAGNGTYRANSPDSQRSQCVTGVQNLYQSLFGINIRYGLGAARNYADLSKISKGAIATYAQGSTMMPQENDIITWNGGAYGHIGMIVETNFDAKTGVGTVSTLEQNRGLNNQIFDYKMTGSRGADGKTHYSIEGFGNYSVMSWQRPANGKTTPTAQAPQNFKPTTSAKAPATNRFGLLGKIANSLRNFFSRSN